MLSSFWTLVLLSLVTLSCKSDEVDSRHSIRSQHTVASGDNESSGSTAGNEAAPTPAIDVDLLKKADSALTFVDDWSDTLRGKGPGTTDPSGYDQPEVQRYYDTHSFAYIQHQRSGEPGRGAWPVPSSFPDLEHIISHRIYLPQFVKTPSSSSGSSVIDLSFVEDRTLLRPNSKPDSTRGNKILSLRMDGESYKIVAEEEFPRAEEPASVPKPQRVDVDVPGAAQYIVVAERPCASVERGQCAIPGVLLLVQGTEGKLLLHMTQRSGYVAPGTFVDDPDHFYLESLHGGTYNGFSFARDGNVLSVGVGWSDAEVRQRIREWSPIARIALGSEAPIPLWCLPLHHSEPKPKPCFEKEPTL